MGQPVEFAGVNRHYGPPPGREDSCGCLSVFSNGICAVSAWEMTDAEIEEIVRTRRVFMSSMTGEIVFPTFIGSESVVRSMVVDYGKVWPKS